VLVDLRQALCTEPLLPGSQESAGVASGCALGRCQPEAAIGQVQRFADLVGRQDRRIEVDDGVNNSCIPLGNQRVERRAVWLPGGIGAERCGKGGDLLGNFVGQGRSCCLQGGGAGIRAGQYLGRQGEEPPPDVLQLGLWTARMSQVGWEDGIQARRRCGAGGGKAVADDQLFQRPAETKRSARLISRGQSDIGDFLGGNRLPVQCRGDSGHFRTFLVSSRRLAFRDHVYAMATGGRTMLVRYMYTLCVGKISALQKRVAKDERMILRSAPQRFA